MAKKVAEGMKKAWAAAKKDFSENNTPYLDFKQDVIDILELAKSNTSLGKGGKSSSPTASLSGSKSDLAVNQDVGSELLTQYKNNWSEIHNGTEEASKLATKMNQELQVVHHSVTQSHQIIGRCQDEFGCLVDVVGALDEAQNKVDSIGELLQKVEQSIIEYGRVKAQLDMERRKHSLKVQQEHHLSESNAKLNQLKKVLDNEKQLSQEFKKEVENKEIMERQNTFQEMFDQQMADYRQRGEVERPIIGGDERERSGSHLEEVLIEDEDGTASLQEFLSDVALEDEVNDTGTSEQKVE